jgi:hypothetical protein
MCSGHEEDHPDPARRHGLPDHRPPRVGRVALELKRAWHDGTREFVFEPLEFLERLAAMTPRPETNLPICHGVLAPRARWRARVVVYGRVAPEPEPTASTGRRSQVRTARG